MIGWILMVVNLFIGLAAIVCCLIRGDDLFSYQLTLLIVFIISMVIGLLAFIDMIVYRKMRKDIK